MTDPIADMLTRIRNAIAARHEAVIVPASQLKEALCRILKDNHYISNFVREEKKPQDDLRIFLKYDLSRKSPIRQMTRVSKPGRRIYKGYKEITPYLRGMGIAIVSTPKGLMTDREARQNKVGGELLCEIW